MLHAFEHFIFCFEAAVFNPTDDSATAQLKTNFQYQEQDAHGIKIETLKSLRIKNKLQQFDHYHTNQPFS